MLHAKMDRGRCFGRLLDRPTVSRPSIGLCPLDRPGPKSAPRMDGRCLSVAGSKPLQVERREAATDVATQPHLAEGLAKRAKVYG